MITPSMRKHLQGFDFESLFIEELGWDTHRERLVIPVDDESYTLNAVAEKRGMVVLRCQSIPEPARRRYLEREVSKQHRENLIIFIDSEKTQQVWVWARHENGRTAHRERRYDKGQSGEKILQALDRIAFSLDEEDSLTIVDVTSRVRAAFDVERITRRFYDQFKREHDTFLKFINGIPDAEFQRWYASVMLNRLMFIYFIQRKGFLDGDRNYLRTKLGQSQGNYYRDFLRPLFFKGFATKKHPPEIERLLGKVPYLNGGLFMPHTIEERYGDAIQIPDEAFEKLFRFFDEWDWHLDERPLKDDREINPDVLGYIFEKYINQKQMGAYYTKEDITEYISKNTVIPYLFDHAAKEVKIAFDGDHSLWDLLCENPDRYIYAAVAKGTNLPLPDNIAAGIADVSKRTDWNTPAPTEFALPTEIWREVVSRRQRYDDLKRKLSGGEVRSINDLVTLNLNIQQFAQDVIDNTDSPDVVRAFWKAINSVTVLDPTCGSGAFLFAALNILEPLYEACLERMEGFITEEERANGKTSQKYSDFRKILERVQQHPNRRYFILKSTIINNLFGVDIMEEAVEICKLRLFLKLVAQIGENDPIEPLPDIDFNIRAGNTLVGFATQDEVRKALSMTAGGQHKLIFDEDAAQLTRIEEKAGDIDRLFKRFREQQTELGGDVLPEDKTELRNRLKDLEGELNVLLAGQYSVDASNTADYNKWIRDHSPFHWFIEFYTVLKEGGFKAIIGNPPYAKVPKELNRTMLYSTYKTALEKWSRDENLYTLIVERSLKLLKDGGKFGMILPLSISFSTKKPFEGLRTLEVISKMAADSKLEA
jgi:hypothetical protein